jgi:hypothetical protein
VGRIPTASSSISPTATDVSHVDIDSTVGRILNFRLMSPMDLPPNTNIEISRIDLDAAADAGLMAPSSAEPLWRFLAARA